MHQLQLFESTKDIYARVFRCLCPRTALPEIVIAFKSYRNANCYIRWKNQRIEVRHADLLMSAPPAVTEAIAFILLARLYRKQVPEEHVAVYRAFMNDGGTRQQVEVLRRERSAKRMAPAQGTHYNLDQLFDEVNHQWFESALPRPAIGWTLSPARRILGHYDPVHHAIVVSRFLDSPEAGRDLVRYVMFHEMLHIKHPIRYEEGRRVIHSKAFRAEERRYPGFEELKEHLRALCNESSLPRRRRRRR
ncbi:MAG: M48 family metallopeptidase [Bryobacterales bacterium]|nr:M48 family metallopeptidase [Bryobacterales bacterium]